MRAHQLVQFATVKYGSLAGKEGCVEFKKVYSVLWKITFKFCETEAGLKHWGRLGNLPKKTVSFIG